MEKLNISIFKSLLTLAFVAIASTAAAGPYRMNSKAPVIVPAPKLGYVFGYGGYSFGSDYSNIGRFDNPNPHYSHYVDPTAIPIAFSTDGGWTAGGGFGLYSPFLGGSRVEIEGSYLTNDSGSQILFDNTLLPGFLRFQTNTVMVNFLKEFPIGQQLIGYTGFGLGYASTKLIGDTGGVGYDSRDDGFAWQYIFGVDFPVTQSVALFTQYRYLSLPDNAYETVFRDFNQLVDDSNHSVLFGARLSF